MDPKDAERRSQGERGIDGFRFQNVSEPDLRLRTIALEVNPQIPVALDFEMVAVHTGDSPSSASQPRVNL